MDENIFWALISRMGPDLCPGRLTIAHGVLPEAQAAAFARQLERAAAELDTLAHRRFAREAAAHALPDAESRFRRPVPLLGAPSMRELQHTVVALGRDAWAAVVAVPSLLAASWPVELGRHLLELSSPPLLRLEDLAQGA